MGFDIYHWFLLMSKSLEAKSVLFGSVQTFPNRNFAASSESLCRARLDIVMEENHTVSSLRRPGNILLEAFREFLGVARYLCVHQQHTQRSPEDVGQHCVNKWCHPIPLPGLAGGVSTPCCIAYCWQWNDGSTCYRHQQRLDEDSCLPLLHKFAENWDRSSFLLLCVLLKHETLTCTGLTLVWHIHQDRPHNAVG